MAFKVQVGPPQIAIHQGQTVLITEQDGQINWPSEEGLYFFDTRVVSSWAIYANGEVSQTDCCFRCSSARRDFGRGAELSGVHPEAADLDEKER